MTTGQIGESVIIVDDDPDILMMFEDTVRADGYSVLTARGGDEALEKVKANDVFLVITDYRMPEMDGLALAEKLLAIKKVPVVMLTGFSDRQTALNALRNGILEILDKPVRGDALRAVIAKYAKKRIEDLAQEASETVELRRIFVEEATELLRDVDATILSLEERDDPQVVNVLYRAIHTVKGGAGTIAGAELLAKLAHAFENILSALKDHKIPIDRDLINVMLQSADALQSHVRALSSGGGGPDISSFVAELHRVLVGSAQAGRKTTAGNAAASSPTSPPTKPGPANADDIDEGVLVSNEKLDSFMELAGELVAFKNTFQGIIRLQAAGAAQSKSQLDSMNKSLTKISDQIQAQIMDIRKISLRKVFAKFPRAVRQVASELGKEIRFDIVGQELAVDKTIARALGSSLIHAVRNSCDHGVETPDTRALAGKARIGSVAIAATQTEDVITVIVSDDGAGLNRRRIAEKAVQNGLIDAARAGDLSDEEVYDFVFRSGFSTAATVTNVSGRGVGMDVVRSSIASVGGAVRLKSGEKFGTELIVTIPIPKTVMVEQSVICRSGRVKLVIPLSCIADIRPLAASELTFVQVGWTCEHRGRTIPISSYESFVRQGFDSDHSRHVGPGELVIVISYGEHDIGLRVEEILDQLEAVVRPFNKVVRKLPGFRGTSVLPDESLAYVINPEDLVGFALNRRPGAEKVAA